MNGFWGGGPTLSHFYVLGGSGRTGGHIVDHALSRGHTVTALVRHPTELAFRAGLTVVEGTPVHRDDVDGAIDGADAVIVALNSTRRSDTPWAKPVSPPRLMADSVANATGAESEARARTCQRDARGLASVAPQITKQRPSWSP